MQTPSLKSLHYFSVVADQQSIKSAAEKLFVTQAAVSQQIKTLEQSLGLNLFIREHRALKLTPEAKQLLPFLKDAFTTIQHGLQTLNQDSKPNILTISVLPSFASRWLIPRLDQFYSQHPGLTINLSMTEQLENFSDSNVDLAIRFGNGEHENLIIKPLMKEYFYPVCHPEFLKKRSLKTIQDLQPERLIDDIDCFGFISWDCWLSTHNEDTNTYNSRQSYDGSHYVIEAALSKQGISMARHSLAAEAIRQGNLIQLFPEMNDSAIEPEQFHYVCAPEHHFQRPKVSTFCDWVTEEANKFYREHSIKH